MIALDATDFGGESISRARRQQLLSAAPGFSRLPERVRDALAAEWREEQYAPGAVVVAEHDLADRVCLIARGRAEVTSRGPAGPVVLATLGPGELFGEIAFLSAGRRRRATVTALEPLTILSLAAASFDSLLAAEPGLRAELDAVADDLLAVKLLKEASPFTALDPVRLRRLAGRLGRVEAAAGETIIRQGEVGDTCYLVRTGSVEVVAATGASPERQLATLGVGTVFGEAALLTRAARNATVRALEPTTLLALGREDLLEAMGTSPEVGKQLLALVQLRDRPCRAPGVVAQSRTTADGDTITVLKNPERGTYFQLSAQGWFIWQRLDGAATLRDLALDLLGAFKVFSPHVIADLIGDLAAAGFVVTRARPDDAARAFGGVRGWRRVLLTLRRLVTAQAAWNGADAALTRAFHGAGRALFTPAAQAGMAAIAAGGLATLLAHSREAIHAASTAAPWWYLLPVYLGSIAVHEAAHAFTVKSFGREVPRVGVGWYWVTPVAFVDTSDMWLADRWPRIAVSLAGPYANLVLAGAASIAAPFVVSPAQAALWQVALVSCLLAVVNMNPLLDLDGYYVLMDWLERPNLRAHTLAWLREHGMAALHRPPLWRGRRAEAWFAAASIAYLVIVAAIVAGGVRAFRG